MKYSELDDCPNGCPLYEEGICPGGMACYGGEPIEPPCTCFDADTDLEEWISDFYARRRRAEDAEDRRIQKEHERKERNAIAQRKRWESKWAVLAETREIKSLQKRISGNEAAIRMGESLAFAINITNEMFRYDERVSTSNSPLLIENEKYRQRISELEKIKKLKLTELRKRRKNEAKEKNDAE